MVHEIGVICRAQNLLFCSYNYLVCAGGLVEWAGLQERINRGHSRLLYRHTVYYVLTVS